MRVKQMAAIVNAPAERTVRASHLLRNSVHAILATVRARECAETRRGRRPIPARTPVASIFCTGNQSDGIY